MFIDDLQMLPLLDENNPLIEKTVVFAGDVSPDWSFENIPGPLKVSDARSPSANMLYK